jgi:hypothetical protein
MGGGDPREFPRRWRAKEEIFLAPGPSEAVVN